METWRTETRLGIHDLSRHRPRAALGHLSRALEHCPETRSTDLVRVLFYLGVTMRRLGMPNPALRSWIVCRKLSKRGFGSKMAGRYANEYGMDRQDTRDEDDWQAFRSVHVRRYLTARPDGRFGSSMEAMLVSDVLRDRWRELAAEHDMAAMTAADKCALFRKVTVVFPWCDPGESGPTIPVSFRARRRVAFDDRCPCGSGRPFRTCCGRTVAADEMTLGVF